MSSLKTESMILLVCWLGVARAAQCQAPAHPVVLHSAQLEVILDRDDGLPNQYQLASNQALIHGEDSGREIAATVFRSESHEFAKVTLRPQTVKATATRADFLFTAQLQEHLAVSFTLRYEVQGPTVYVSRRSGGEARLSIDRRGDTGSGDHS